MCGVVNIVNKVNVKVRCQFVFVIAGEVACWGQVTHLQSNMGLVRDCDQIKVDCVKEEWTQKIEQKRRL
jgi:hypothetical protein